MYDALLFNPETITLLLMLYSPSLVLSRQKNAGLKVRETDLVNERVVNGCSATKFRLAKSSA
jgi:hypothetical protein